MEDLAMPRVSLSTLDAWSAVIYGYQNGMIPLRQSLIDAMVDVFLQDEYIVSRQEYSREEAVLIIEAFCARLDIRLWEAE